MVVKCVTYYKVDYKTAKSWVFQLVRAFLKPYLCIVMVLLKMILSHIYNYTTHRCKVLILSIGLLERRYTSIEYIAMSYMLVDLLIEG